MLYSKAHFLHAAAKLCSCHGFEKSSLCTQFAAIQHTLLHCRYYETLPKEAQIPEPQWENSFLRTVRMLRKFRPPHEEDTAEYDVHTPVFEPLDYPWDQDSQDDQAIFDLLRENLNFKEPEARRLLLIAWCLAFARPSSRPFFRQHYIKHEECLFVGKHLEDRYAHCLKRPIGSFHVGMQSVGFHVCIQSVGLQSRLH